MHFDSKRISKYKTQADDHMGKAAEDKAYYSETANEAE